MDSPNLWEIVYLGLGVSDIVLLMVVYSAFFFHTFKHIGVCVDSFQGRSCFTIMTFNKYVNIA